MNMHVFDVLEKDFKGNNEVALVVKLRMGRKDEKKCPTS